MKHIAIAALMLFAVAGAQAEEAVPKNPLTEKEIAEGWIALFDGKTTYGWTSPNESKWTIVDGMLAPQKAKEGLLVTTIPFVDYELHMEIQQSRTGSFRMVFNADHMGKAQDAHSDSTPLGRLQGGWLNYQATVRGGRLVAQSITSLTGGSGVGQKGSSPATPRSGHLALVGNGFVVRNVKLRPTPTVPLMNGKNLDGWNPFPARKSKFGVTKEGWLSVKDGPGDLQTTKQWDNFILQLECKTNGKHLNSGVFFRCLPGEFTQGYEAQIHNGFGPEKEIPLQVFDAKAGKLIDTKVKTTAMDFGTGAIYRRQPARFQAAKDNEWFTMTVVANGRHFATWVNGLQVLDWTDHRPPGDNARKGSYLKKGAISLQGHDPTTDLLFRNFRIAELPSTSDEKPAKDDKTGLDALQGTWIITAYADKGKPAERESDDNQSWVFEGNKLTHYSDVKRKRIKLTATLKVDSSKKPAHIDFLFDDEYKGKRVKWTTYGIYSLKADELMICVPEKFDSWEPENRPTEFKSTMPPENKNSGFSVYVFKKK